MSVVKKKTNQKKQLIIGAITIVGLSLVFVASASSNFASFETENGTKSVEVIDISDTNASQGEAIQFGAAVTPVPGSFIRRADTGPQASTFGHTPYGALRPWTSSNTISDSSAPRDPDGWMRLKGYEFNGQVKVTTGNVEISDCKINPGTQTAPNQGMIYTSSSAPSGSMIIDHCNIDQGQSGYSAAGINIYQPIQLTVRYTLIEGVGDGIKANSNCLYEHNYIKVNGQGNQHSPGHIDGIQGSYYKVNWTARHNTIIGGIGQAPNGGSYRDEAGGNIGIWAALDGAPYNYGVVAEDNYVDGFNTGISLQGTDANNPNVVKRNTFGKNFRYYPVYRIRTWTEYPHTVVEDNNVYDRLFNESTGEALPY